MAQRQALPQPDLFVVHTPLVLLVGDGAAQVIETTNEKSSGEKRVIREKMSLASFPWKGNSNKPLSSKKIAGVRTRGKESRSVAA